MAMALTRKDSLKPKKTDEEELLVFGYSCKLFRDDEKAQIIDEGQHLIPWMGQENLKIDRYDARGTLYDLSQTEAPPGGYDRFIELKESEKVIELACDEERYRSLHTNEEEDRLYREEEEKRLEASDGKAYGQVEYKYDDKKTSVESSKEESEIDDDRPFVAPPMLDIPLNMPLPATMKHNAVIEKTAMFISSQGAQMEIILKAKQAGNPMFDFLTFGNALHGYYRLVLGYIKSGRYVPPAHHDPPPEDSPPAPEEESYLHPLLTTPSAPAVHSTAPQTEDSASVYSELLTKLKKKAHQLKLQNEQKILEEQNTAKIQKKVEPPKSVPPSDVQLSISKMASYAAKHGRGFEAVVRNKKDARFQFLESSHIYHQFYLQKIAFYERIGQENVKVEPPKPTSEVEPPKPEVKPPPAPTTETKKKEESSAALKVAPICFAIKPKEVPAMREKSALPLEETSDDEENEDTTTSTSQPTSEQPDKHTNQPEPEDLDSQIDFELVDDQAKIPTVRDKQLQLERKRKVSAFLKSLNVKETPEVASPPREVSPKKKTKRRESRSSLDQQETSTSCHRP